MAADEQLMRWISAEVGEENNDKGHAWSSTRRTATIVSEWTAVVCMWYDNEFGYTKQVIRLAKYVAKVRRNIYC